MPAGNCRPAGVLAGRIPPPTVRHRCAGLEGARTFAARRYTGLAGCSCRRARSCKRGTLLHPRASRRQRSRCCSARQSNPSGETARSPRPSLNQFGISHRYEEFPDNHPSVDYRTDESLPFLACVVTASRLSHGLALRKSDWQKGPLCGRRVRLSWSSLAVRS
jgi:hypothetical protein